MKRNIEIISELVNYIELHLHENLNLDTLSKKSGYSKYHLHRMFTNVVGFPIHTYVQRRKLTEAARLLVFSKEPILQVAILAGYETQQSFTKAFKDFFNETPQGFRQRQVFHPRQLKFHVDGIKKLRGDMIMDFKIVTQDTLLLAGYMANTKDGFSVIGECWNNLHNNKDKLNNRIDKEYLIALHDYSAAKWQQGEQPNFNYYAAAVVSSFDNLPDGMATKELPRSNYAVFTYYGNQEDSMQPVSDYIYKEWFPESTYRFNEKAMFDFTKNFEETDQTGKAKVEYWVPVL